MTKLTPKTFDGLIVRGASPAHTLTREDRIIWTLKAIGQRIGRGRDFAAALAAEPGSPIKQRGRQYCVVESELVRFVAGKDAA